MQPHTAKCRHRIETALSSDMQVKNAKARMKERSAKMKSSPNEIPDTAKRRKLGGHRGPGDEAGGSDQTCGVFDGYRAEYSNDCDDSDGNAKRQRTEESVLLREQAPGSHQPA